MDKAQKDLAKVIENYFGADAGYLDIDCFTLARRIMEAGWTEPVRCKDCKHYKPMKPYPSYNGNTNYCCRCSYTKVSDKDFCSFGERRTDGSEA